jgi:hypothetical protein
LAKRASLVHVQTFHKISFSEIDALWVRYSRANGKIVAGGCDNLLAALDDGFQPTDGVM